MYISELTIKNFRCFGSDENALRLPLERGLNTLVGENDAGKTAILDAVRMLLGTSDQESLRPGNEDFHFADGAQASELEIQARFTGLSWNEKAQFADFLTYETNSENNGDDAQNSDSEVLIITLASTRYKDHTYSNLYSGLPVAGHGLKDLTPEIRERLRATYLKPLRDAEREMDAGRGSRISKILKVQDNIDEGGIEVDLTDPDSAFGHAVKELGIVGIAKLVNQLLEQQPAINKTTNTLNDKFLQPLQMQGDELKAELGVAANAGNAVLKQQMLEKIGITLESDMGKRGLGSNNLLYIACELLLLADSLDELPMLIIEEPEAHLHPQRQLRLIQFLQQIIEEYKAKYDLQFQILLSTHSPTLASQLPIKCMTLVHKGKVMPLAHTRMQQDNFTFLERFIDATKSNLFFCRGLMVVEGDAENLLMPSISKVLQQDFTENGISIVNVGHTGLSRYANLFSGTDQFPNPGINVACLHDVDLIPYKAAIVAGKPTLKHKDSLANLYRQIESALNNNQIPDYDSFDDKLPKNVISGFLENPRDIEKTDGVPRNYEGERVNGYYSGPWTLEYSLAFAGLAKEVTIAACLAKAETSSRYNDTKRQRVINVAEKYYEAITVRYSDENEQCAKVYELYLDSVDVSDLLGTGVDDVDLIPNKKASKAAAGQHLGELIEERDQALKEEGKSPLERKQFWENHLPDAVVSAVKHVVPSATAVQ